MIDVKERFSESKNPGCPSEDRMVVTPHFCAVIDGSTSKVISEASDVPTTGWMAAEILALGVRSLPPRSTIDEAGKLLTLTIARFYEEHGMTEVARRHAERRLTASMVLYSCARNEVWMFGDCQFRFGGCTYTHPKRVDTILSGIRADVIHYLIRKGYRVDELRADDRGRTFIFEALRDQCNFQNAPQWNPYSYSVLDGFPLPPAEELSLNDSERVGKASVRAFRTRRPVSIHLPARKGLRHQSRLIEGRPLLILSSDGYPVLAETLAETERILCSVLQEDPLMINIAPSTKGLAPGASSFDDRTYLSFFL